MSETQERFKLRELQHITFVCKCGLEITHDVTTGMLDVQNPPRCPKCGESLEQYCKAVHSYRLFYDLAKDLPLTLLSKK